MVLVQICKPSLWEVTEGELKASLSTSDLVWPISPPYRLVLFCFLVLKRSKTKITFKVEKKSRKEIRQTK